MQVNNFRQVQSNNAQVMVLTGCASGIGRHMAGVLAKQGHKLILTDINREALNELVKELSVSSEQLKVCRLDVRDLEAWTEVCDQAVTTWGHLDVLMNIAGYSQPGYIYELEPEEIDLHLDINARGVMYGTRVMAAQMVKQGYGHIINMASFAGIAPLPGLSLYCASKFAIRGFSLAAAQELRPLGVYMTVICMDAVQTPMLEKELHRKEAAVVFSGSRILTVQEVEQAIIKTALKKRPLEVMLPVKRGWMMKLGGAFPSITLRANQNLAKKGLIRQAALQRKNRLSINQDKDR